MKMNVRTILRIVVAVVVIAVLGWQWLGRHHAHDHPATARVAAATTAAKPATPVKPAPPATLRMGSLTLTACELKQPQSAATTPAFCAHYPVPENHTDPHSRAIALKLAIIQSASQVPDKDLVVYLAGGPGQSSIQSYPELAPGFAPLLKNHDLLLLDQRGTGGSNPLRCPAVEKQMDALPASATTAQRAQLVGACAKEVEKTASPQYYTTLQSVADLEAVRKALGSPKLDLVGVSYGTRLAQKYAQAYPAAVRSIVLDGVVPNQLVLGETFASSLQHALKLQAAACSATPACKKAYGDWYTTLHQLYAKLKSEPPQKVTFPDPTTFQPVTRTLDADTLASTVRLFAYSAATSALLPLSVSQAARGNYAPLLGQSHLINGDLAAGLQFGMNLSVVCSEDAPLLKPRPQDADTLLGNTGVDSYIADCKVWPHAPLPPNFHAPFKSSIPTLLISGSRDPVTPPAFAAEVLKGLSNGRSLVANGLGHAEAIDAGCVPRLVDKFIDKLQPKQLDATCLKRIGPIPAFVNFNGATP
ncbi:MAG TPA: alpha/beta fold hydrolase [Rhodanobacteraceae bacterium]